ncbi:hypothetical protein ABTY20_33860 [Streptomyces sp. NPDC126497]|uniref:hypothetical protein n=1 Tax=Streptomyces sp. NPDC126497 TaxID=3155313 RepID=UPI00332E1DCF
MGKIGRIIKAAAVAGASSLLIVGGTAAAQAAPGAAPARTASATLPVSASTSPQDVQAAYTVTAWARANVRSCPYTSCSIVSHVVAGGSYSANCWVWGQTITAEGYTNGRWARLNLRAGGYGYVSNIYLNGDEYAGLPGPC